MPNEGQNNIDGDCEPMDHLNEGNSASNEDNQMASDSQKPGEQQSDESLLDLLNCEEKEVNLDSSQGDAEVNGHSENDLGTTHLHQTQ